MKRETERKKVSRETEKGREKEGRKKVIRDEERDRKKESK
jgi:hypothetical protein